MARPASHFEPPRPGKSSSWGMAWLAGKDDVRDAGPTTQSHAGVTALDNVRAVFWHAYRHLFPPHSLAAQTPNGSMVISWSIMDEPDACHPYAAPVMLRFDEALVEAMRRAEPVQRVRIAERYEATLREGLRGYDPFARFPNARVINIG